MEYLENKTQFLFSNIFENISEKEAELHLATIEWKFHGNETQLAVYLSILQ